MGIPLQKWLETHADKFKNYSLKELGDLYFFRDEVRAIVVDENKFFSPADGLIISQEIVKPKDKIMEIKGQKYTLEDILPNIELKNIEYVNISIFMTFYDVHVNRIPYDGFLTFKEIQPIKSYNMPMIAMEKRIFDDYIAYKQYNDGYLFNNSRMINTIYNNKKDLKYWVVQIADSDVSTFTHFTIHQNRYFQQSQRFSFIRWGSQCNLIIPCDKYKFKFIQKPLYHVKCCDDALVEFI